MTTPADTAFCPDPSAGADTARAMIQKAAQTIAKQKERCANASIPPHETSDAKDIAQAALENAERWHAALCRHGQATPDDHAIMDDLRVNAATVKPKPVVRWCDVCLMRHQPPLCQEREGRHDNDLLKMGLAAAGGGILGAILGDILD